MITMSGLSVEVGLEKLTNWQVGYNIHFVTIAVGEYNIKSLDIICMSDSVKDMTGET